MDKPLRSKLFAITALGMIGGSTPPSALRQWPRMTEGIGSGYCQCGKRISSNKTQCKACAERGETK